MPFSQETFQHAPWSMSKAQAAINCPFSFDLKYVKKTKGTSKPLSPAARIGVAAHAAIEDFLKNGNIKYAMDQAATKNRLTSVEVGELLSFTHAIVDFKRRFDEFSKKFKCDPASLIIEGKFGLDKDLESTTFFAPNVFFRGVWDLCIKASNGQPVAVIIDHKSGDASKITKEELTEKHRAQLYSYSLGASAKFKDIVAVKTMFHYMQSQEIVALDSIPIDQIRGSIITWLEDFLNRAAESAKTTKAQTGWWCDFCEYLEVCPANYKG